MPIVFLCGVPFSGGDKLARSLADKLGYAFLTRDDVLARANEAGIPVGRLEVAMVRKPAVRERLARLKQRYLALATATICEKAAEGDLVYYGRAGHFLLPGVSHVLRARVLPEPEQRLETVMQRTKLPREKAEPFLQALDGDIRAWVRFVHGVEMDDLSRYDFVVNLERVSVENASAALCAMSELPDFRPTPASRKAMDERLLQARCRIKLALDPRTGNGDLTVHASDGVVTVTYPPADAALAPAIPEVLAGLPGLRNLRCTVASTNILWIQEEFRPSDPTLGQVRELARRWGAAVELVRYLPAPCEARVERARLPEAAPTAPAAVTGGIEDDVVEKIPRSETSLRDTLEELVREGQSGGAQTVAGTPSGLVAAINPEISYSLVAVGQVCLDKPPEVRLRAARDLVAQLGRAIKAPVVSTSELQSRLVFGARQWAGLALGAAVVVALLFTIFTHQSGLLDLLGGAGHERRRWVAPVLVGITSPLMAWAYGKVAGSILKLLRLE